MDGCRKSSSLFFGESSLVAVMVAAIFRSPGKCSRKKRVVDANLLPSAVQTSAASLWLPAAAGISSSNISHNVGCIPLCLAIAIAAIAACVR